MKNLTDKIMKQTREAVQLEKLYNDSEVLSEMRYSLKQQYFLTLSTYKVALSTSQRNKELLQKLTDKFDDFEEIVSATIKELTVEYKERSDKYIVDSYKLNEELDSL